MTLDEESDDEGNGGWGGASWTIGLINSKFEHAMGADGVGSERMSIVD